MSAPALVQPADVTGAGLPLGMGGEAAAADEEERHVFDFSDEPSQAPAAKHGSGQRGRHKGSRNKRKGRWGRG